MVYRVCVWICAIAGHEEFRRLEGIFLYHTGLYVYTKLATKLPFSKQSYTRSASALDIVLTSGHSRKSVWSTVFMIMAQKTPFHPFHLTS
jgi:hypothetical protein